MPPSGGARDTLCEELENHKTQSFTASGPQRFDTKHAKQQHFAKHIFSMFTKSPFSWDPFLDAVIYIEIVVNIYENSIKWKEIFTRLLSIAFALVCNEDASHRERFVNMTKLHHLTNLHHHTLDLCGFTRVKRRCWSLTCVWNWAEWLVVLKSRWAPSSRPLSP